MVTDALSPNMLNQVLTGLGKMAFYQSMELLQLDDCNIGRDGF